MTRCAVLLVLLSARSSTAARRKVASNLESTGGFVAYKCEEIPTYAADPVRACAGVPGNAACFSDIPNTFWSCAGAQNGPTFVSNNHCSTQKAPDGNPYKGVCLYSGHAEYGRTIEWDGGAAAAVAAIQAATVSFVAPAGSCRRRRCVTPAAPAPPSPQPTPTTPDIRRRRRARHPETSRMAPGWVPAGRDGQHISADAIGWETAPNTSFGTGLWCETGAPADGWSPGSTTCPEKVGTPLEVNILTYNLFWWNLFGQRHGNDNSAGKLILRNAPYDFMGFQECSDINHVLHTSGLANEFTGYGPAQAVAIAWNRHTWHELEKGYTDVAEDSHLQWYGVRSAIWARLQHKESGKTVLFVNHHGPLPTHIPGGICGPEATAYNILRLIGERAHVGDTVFLIGDFNAYEDAQTFTELRKYLTLNYKGQAFRGVDEFFTNCGEVLNTANLGTGGSDHEALKVTYGMY